ncbi:Hypothetical protein FKW44_016651 [Caligus rogercresseyi]|uniref:Uncharacterized protein n=1 Tax=Caligus rogercresseyi TaxID=217165 RepID=A0A7T8H2S8_CALRO|nr:Hypothetical protein FKW44_016651 [Caligus rogercresseyi]
MHINLLKPSQEEVHYDNFLRQEDFYRDQVYNWRNDRYLAESVDGVKGVYRPNTQPK